MLDDAIDLFGVRFNAASTKASMKPGTSHGGDCGAAWTGGHTRALAEREAVPLLRATLRRLDEPAELERRRARIFGQEVADGAALGPGEAASWRLRVSCGTS